MRLHKTSFKTAILVVLAWGRKLHLHCPDNRFNSYQAHLAQQLLSHPLPMTAFVSSVPTPIARSARASSDAEQLPQVSGWQLVGRLGGGRITEVFQARAKGASASIPAGYAIKLIAQDYNEPEGIESLHREGVACKAVASPHVVPLLAANLHQVPYFLVMPFLPGKSLADLLQVGARPVLPVTLWIARQVATGLEAMQSAGWRHGDVKPSNVMVSPCGHVTLIDLGFAQRLDHPADTLRTERAFTATLGYSAPERLTSQLQGGAQSDLYSLGVMLYELLTGRLPFGASDPAELVRQHREETPLDLRVLMPHIPTRVARLVLAMLQKNPLRRPQLREVILRLTALEIETFSQRSIELEEVA